MFYNTRYSMAATTKHLYMGDFGSIMISEKFMNYILETFRPRRKAFGKGELILEKNTAEDRLCLLVKGVAYLCIENENGGKQLLDYFTKGAVICHEMLPDIRGGHCFIQAKYPCIAAFLSDRELIGHMLKQNDEDLAQLCSAIFRSALSARNRHCHILQQKTIRGKLLAFLHDLRVRQGSTTVHIPMPYSDLADYLTIDRSSLMTELSKMHGDGLIEKKAREIHISCMSAADNGLPRT